jgi:transposase
MSKSSYRSYTNEFKQEALALLQSSGKKAGQIEQDLGITPGLLRKWQAKYQAVVKSGMAESGELGLTDLETARREIRRLQREVLELQEEREILKKAVSIFSRRSA